MEMFFRRNTTTKSHHNNNTPHNFNNSDRNRNNSYSEVQHEEVSTTQSILINIIMKPFSYLYQLLFFLFTFFFQTFHAYSSISFSTSSTRFQSFFHQQKIKLNKFFQLNTDITIETDYEKTLDINELLVNPIIDVEKETGKQAICVIGGGFAGLYTALKLDSKIDHQKAVVYLIDSKERFVFLPLLYELAVGSASLVEVAPRYEDLLSGSKVQFLRGNVYNIDFTKQVCDIITPNKKKEEVTGRLQPIKYSKLVLATGNQPRTDMIPGAAKYSIPFYSIENAYQISNRLKEITQKYLQKKFIQIVVIGGSYSGVELATNLVKTLGKKNCNLNIIDRGNKLLPYSADYNRDVAERSLAYHGITVRHNTKVKEVKENGLSLLDETDNEYFLDADLILFTAGSQPSSLIKQLSIEKDKNHKILVDETLRSKQYENVFAVGDCSFIEGNPVPATAQVAMQQSFTVTKNLLIQLENEERDTTRALQKFKFLNLGEMLSLGDYDATISSLNGWVGLSGPLASIGRRAIYAIRMPTNTQAVKALITATAVTSGKFLSSFFNDQIYGKPSQDFGKSKTEELHATKEL